MQINKIRDNERDIRKGINGTEKITRIYLGKPFTTKLESLEQFDRFLCIYSIQKFKMRE